MWVKAEHDRLAGFTHGSRMATTIEYRAEWVQRESELNTGLNGSRDGQK